MSVVSGSGNFASFASLASLVICLHEFASDCIVSSVLSSTYSSFCDDANVGGDDRRIVHNRRDDSRSNSTSQPIFRRLGANRFRWLESDLAIFGHARSHMTFSFTLLSNFSRSSLEVPHHSLQSSSKSNNGRATTDDSSATSLADA